jgi:TetR/AcrR family transcriptional regulator, transcriptional repressor for nem operon
MTATRPGKEVSTSTRILDIAERLLQQRGYNGFSYADVADELGITKASLHYHFAGKAELGEALIVRYAERFFKALEAIDASVPLARAKLDAYARLYAEVLGDDRMCLCGVLAAEYQTLPAPMRDAVLEFLDQNQAWLASVLTEGRTKRTLFFGGSPADAAQTILGGLEGAMLVARPYGDVNRFRTAARGLLAGLANPH